MTMKSDGGGGRAMAEGKSRGQAQGGGNSRNDGRQGGDGGFSGALKGQLNPRRTPVTSPGYQATLENLGKLATRSIPGPGMIVGAMADIGGFRSGYTNPTGPTDTPGSYDPKQMTPLGGGGGGGGGGGFGAAVAPRTQARAQALAPKPVQAAPVGPQPWWRTPFPNQPQGETGQRAPFRPHSTGFR